MKIKYFSIEITPSSLNGYKSLRFEVRTHDGKVHHLHKEEPDNDFERMYDRYFDSAKHILEAEITKHKEKP